MTRMTGPDCVVMCNLINTHTHAEQVVQQSSFFGSQESRYCISAVPPSQIATAMGKRDIKYDTSVACQLVVLGLQGMRQPVIYSRNNRCLR